MPTGEWVHQFPFQNHLHNLNVILKYVGAIIKFLKDPRLGPSPPLEGGPHYLAVNKGSNKIIFDKHSWTDKGKTPY